MIKKYYELTRGERVRHGEEIHTFDKMDGAYALWVNDKGEPVIGHYDSYELGDEGIYAPVPEKQ